MSKGPDYWFRRGQRDRQAGKSRHWAAAHLTKFEHRDAFQRGWDAGGLPSFEEIHHHGAREFGRLWLLANGEMADAARAAGMQFHEEIVRTQLSFFVYRLLVALYEKEWIDRRSPFADAETEIGSLFKKDKHVFEKGGDA